MTAVIGEEVVRDAYRRGRRKVVVDPLDIVTPQALDVVDRLGMRLLRAPVAPAAPLSTDPGRALSRTLYRRHPGFVPAGRHTSVRPVRLTKVAIVGAGTTGSALASLLASTSAASNVVLIDLIPGLAESTAVDLDHAAALIGTETSTRGATDYAALIGAEVVVVAAESSSDPSMPARILGEIEMAADAIATYSPDAVVIFSGRPSEVFTTQLQRSGNFAPERVLGTGATLASARLISAVAAVANVRRAEVEAVAFGADSNYVPILSAARLRGRLLKDALPAAELDTALAAAADAAAYVESLRPAKPPSIAAAYAALEVINALRGARPGPIPVSVLVEGCYSINDVIIGVTATLTPKGLQSVVELPLSPEELSAVQAAADSVRRRTEEIAAARIP
jgi:malate dehydrogenase